MKKYEIKKDKILNCYIIWEVHRNYRAEVYRNKLKRECKKVLKKLERR